LSQDEILDLIKFNTTSPAATCLLSTSASTRNCRRSSTDPCILGLPHQPPFVFVHEVIKCEPGVTAECATTFEGNDPMFAGHFPDNPLVPGVILAEALAQTAGIVHLRHRFRSQDDALTRPNSVEKLSSGEWPKAKNADATLRDMRRRRRYFVRVLDEQTFNSLP